MDEISARKACAPQPYLDEDFGKELNFQLWSTKGARFNANKRLMLKQKWSTYAITALSLYVITASMMIVSGVSESIRLPSAKLAFCSTVMSILILIISLLESSRQYGLRARQFHDCALAVAKLYRELRLLRTGPEPNPTAEKVRDLTAKYNEILDRCENHEDVDFLILKTKKSEYFNLGFWARTKILLRWYFEVLFVYQLVAFVNWCNFQSP
jgi:hypothetical protein